MIVQGWHMDDCEFLLDAGEPLHRIATRLGTTPAAIEKALRTHRPDLLAKAQRQAAA